eukprot:CAMPEP_0194363288 /NCGR_PEP_ID=MMETSP0174-20130528/11121_1 /TAXON_ID=216777 /ORGANISM="Proboscia alata, Strain PI-D3" /LENGTH=284 /DNA_ID=CAMNT_0039136641 /DNA_START=131 /DNA_END=985 /DNA_ORIENTATION=-
MAEGGLLAWKIQKIDQHRGPLGVTDYSSIKKRLPDPPKGSVWYQDPKTRDWSIVKARINHESDTYCENASHPKADDDVSPTQNQPEVQKVAIPTIKTEKWTVGTKYLEHVVLPSDTLQGLCLRYKVKPVVLRQVNMFSGSTLFLAPKKLLIPCSGNIDISKVRQDTTSEMFKAHSFLSQVNGLRRFTGFSNKEARVYLDLNDWNVDEAVKEALAEIDWEGDQDEFVSPPDLFAEDSVPANKAIRAVVKSPPPELIGTAYEGVPVDSEIIPLITKQTEIEMPRLN